jgi:hypothetical protein
MNHFDIYEDIYNDQFDKTYRFTMAGLTGDIEEDIHILETTIHTLFEYQGQDWVGRGDVFLARNNATIAATEMVLTKLKDQLKENAS